MKASDEQIVVPDDVGVHLGLQEVQNIITGTIGRTGALSVSVEHKIAEPHLLGF